jgi:hypothetical protein
VENQLHLLFAVEHPDPDAVSAVDALVAELNAARKGT